MLLFIFLIFIAVPAIEIAVFVEVGGWLGAWPTIFLTFATAAAGAFMLRVQGLTALRRAEASMARDEPPVRELIDGLCLLLAGLLLLIPGFATDTIGLLLFIPPLRQWIGHRLWRWFKDRPGIRFNTRFTGRNGPGGGAGGRYRGGPAANGDIIDGDFEEVDEDAPNLPPPPPTSSKWGRR